jgi:diguanylate cyclase (GGDEF)-like protein
MSLVVTSASLQRLRDHLRYQATHDSLTGLGNRAALGDALDEAFTEGSSAPTLLLLDLDGFKDVNDALGHPAGDAALVIVASRLRQTVPASAILSRLGGDEFAVLLESANDAAGLADRIGNALRQPYDIAERTVHMSASIGLVPGTASTPTEALRDADVALYEAKAAGRDRWISYGNEQ